MTTGQRRLEPKVNYTKDDIFVQVKSVRLCFGLNDVLAFTKDGKFIVNGRDRTKDVEYL